MPYPEKEPRWITLAIAQELQQRQIATFGGLPGIRDANLLDSALNRPKNRYLYEPDVTYAGLAASYCFGIAKNHPFVDGNKRAAYVAATVFLRLNGIRIAPSQEDIINTILSLASGELEESDLAEWFERLITN